MEENLSSFCSFVSFNPECLTRGSNSSLASMFSVVDCAGRSKFRWMADKGTVWKFHSETVVNTSHFRHGITLQSKRESTFVSNLFFCGRLVEIYRVVGRKILIEDDVSLHGRLDWGKTTKMASRFHISRRENRVADFLALGRVKFVIFPSYAGWILKQLRITVRTGIPIHVSFSWSLLCAQSVTAHSTVK